MDVKEVTFQCQRIMKELKKQTKKGIACPLFL